MKKLIIFLSLISLTAQAAKKELSDKLDDLKIPDDKISPLVTEDKLYLVNTRYSSLLNRHELSFGGGENLTSVSHLESNSTHLRYRYHINPKWSVALKYSQYYNDLTPSGEELYKNEQILADKDFAFKSTLVEGTYNTFYGKMRMTQDTVIYFDQYISLGYGHIDLAAGMQTLTTIDLGFAFWLGKNMSARIGLNNEFYTETQLTGTNDVHNALGYFELGYLFGQGDLK